MYQPYQPTWVNPFLTQNPYQQTPTVQPYQQPTNGLVWVAGPQSALQCNLPPNSTSIPMFDNTGVMRFYVVSTDGTGTKTIETFDYSQHIDEAKQADQAQWVSRSEFEALAAKVEGMRGGAHGADGPDATQAGV